MRVVCHACGKKLLDIGRERDIGTGYELVVATMRHKHVVWGGQAIEDLPADAEIEHIPDGATLIERRWKRSRYPIGTVEAVQGGRIGVDDETTDAFTAWCARCKRPNWIDVDQVRLVLGPAPPDTIHAQPPTA